MLRQAYEASAEELGTDIERYVDALFSTLGSEFLLMPRGTAFVEYATFAEGYEALKRSTNGFREVAARPVLEACLEIPISLVVLRAMLGFTPPELAAVASESSGVEVSQSQARRLDKQARESPLQPLGYRPATVQQLEAIVAAACKVIEAGPGEHSDAVIHRLGKVDTSEGWTSVRHAARTGVPYCMLLYERYLGRPFATHRDAVSERVGDVLETAVETILLDADISYRKTGRAEKLPGLDQAPDFVIPDEHNPRVMIEAKITSDDGTARDKVTRIQHLRSLSDGRARSGGEGFEVVACIDGRGFGVRRSDARKLLQATRGKVFTMRTLDGLVAHTSLREFCPGG